MKKILLGLGLLGLLVLPACATPFIPTLLHAVTVNTNGVLVGGDTGFFAANSNLLNQVVQKQVQGNGFSGTVTNLVGLVTNGVVVSGAGTAAVNGFYASNSPTLYSMLGGLYYITNSINLTVGGSQWSFISGSYFYVQQAFTNVNNNVTDPYIVSTGFQAPYPQVTLAANYGLYSSTTYTNGICGTNLYFNAPFPAVAGPATSLAASNLLAYSGPIPVGTLTAGATNAPGYLLVDAVTGSGQTNRYATFNGSGVSNVNAVTVGGILPSQIITNGATGVSVTGTFTGTMSGNGGGFYYTNAAGSAFRLVVNATTNGFNFIAQ